MLHRSQEDRGSWAGLGPAAILLLSSVVGAFFIGLAPRAGQNQFAVIAAPWAGLMQAVEMVGAAGGEVVDAGGLSNVIIAHSDDPGFVKALYHAGAWLVLDPILLRGCLDIGARHIQTSAKGKV
jgi:hypothetical protein